MPEAAASSVRRQLEITFQRNIRQKDKVSREKDRFVKYSLGKLHVTFLSILICFINQGQYRLRWISSTAIRELPEWLNGSILDWQLLVPRSIRRKIWQQVSFTSVPPYRNSVRFFRQSCLLNGGLPTSGPGLNPRGKCWQHVSSFSSFLSSSDMQNREVVKRSVFPRIFKLLGLSINQGQCYLVYTSFPSTTHIVSSLNEPDLIDIKKAMVNDNDNTSSMRHVAS